MDLESAGADFDSLTQTSKTTMPEPSAPSSSTILPVTPLNSSVIDIAAHGALASKQ